MNQKPNAKSIIILNLVNNVPMAIVMSLAAPLIMGIPLVLNSVMANILIAFILACVLNMLIPIGKIVVSVPKLLHMDPDSIVGKIVGNIPVCLIFVVVIGLVLNLYNVRAIPDFVFAFIGTFLPLYAICFVVSMVTNPIAMHLAFGAVGERTNG